MYIPTQVHEVQVIKAAQLSWCNENFTKPNLNLRMEERLTILKKLSYKLVTVMNNNFEIYGACQKNDFTSFFPKH